MSAHCSTWLQRAGVADVDPQASPRYRHEALALQATIEGHGVTYVRSYTAAGDLEAGRLIRLFARFSPEDFGVFLVCLAQAAKSAKVAAFRGRIFDELAADGTTTAG